MWALGPGAPRLGAQTGGGVQAGSRCPCPHRGFADGVWPPMHGTSQGALQHPGMILGWPVPIFVWQERGFVELPRPSQGANAVLGAQQTGPDGSPAPCPGGAGDSAPRGYSWKENDELCGLQAAGRRRAPAGRSLRCSRGDWM